MVSLIQQKLSELVGLCTSYRVKRLELFGSGVSDTAFRNGKSDLDFLVEFLPLAAGEHATAYFGFKEALEGLFQCEVDLVMARAVRNRYFLQAIAQQRQVLYAA